MDRRTFLFTSTGAAVGSLLVQGRAECQDATAPALCESGLRTGKPKPLRLAEIPGFLSAAQIAPHHSAHYRGALRVFVDVEQRFDQSFRDSTTLDPAAFDRMKQVQSSRGNSVILHELYFDGLALESKSPPEELATALVRRFGSVERWATDFADSAKAAAGWAMLVVHPVNGKLYNVVSDEHAQGPLWFAAPLVVVDTYEHAFYVDYQNRKAEYVSRFLQHVDWQEAARRYAAVRVS